MTLHRRLAVRAVGPLVRRWTRGSARVLIYHRFDRVGAPRRLAAELFERQLQYLCRHFQPCRLEVIADRLRTGAKLDNLVALTVDDGHADFYDVAYPLLQRYRVPATLFVVTRFVDQATWLWFDALHYLVTHASTGRYRLPVNGHHLEAALGNEGERQELWSRLADACLPLDGVARAAFMESVQDILGVALPPVPTEQYRSISWDELQRLDPDLVDVGSHTCTHPVLSRCSVAELETELSVSKAEIERRLGRPVRAFCYPYGRPGDYNREVVDAVAGAGYASGLVAHGALVGAGADPFTIARIGASHDLDRFYSTVNGCSTVRDRARRVADRTS